MSLIALLRRGVPFALTLKGELEDGQEVPAPEPAPGGVLAADLSLSLPDGDRSDNSVSSSTSDIVPQCDGSFKEDTGENTALLGKSPAGSRTKCCCQWMKESDEKNSLVAQWVKDLGLSLLWHEFSPWPRSVLAAASRC